MNPTPPADATNRFSDRVKHYVLYRPTYPPGLIGLLEREAGLTKESVVADIGSGTGISTEPFLRNGNTVYAVEPNTEMREAAETSLGTTSGFVSVEGTAEKTGLGDASVHLIAAMQAFHWFDAARARAEFKRILRAGGSVVLVWNTRKTGGTKFLQGYEEILKKWGMDYQKVRHDRAGHDAIAAFFAPSVFVTHRLENAQVFDFEGLHGRVLSSSYAPNESHPNHAPMMRELRELFDAHQREGNVRFEYDTEVHVGKL